MRYLPQCTIKRCDIEGPPCTSFGGSLILEIITKFYPKLLFALEEIIYIRGQVQKFQISKHLPNAQNRHFPVIAEVLGTLAPRRATTLTPPPLPSSLPFLTAIAIPSGHGPNPILLSISPSKAFRESSLSASLLCNGIALHALIAHSAYLCIHSSTVSHDYPRLSIALSSSKKFGLASRNLFSFCRQT